MMYNKYPALSQYIRKCASTITVDDINRAKEESDEESEYKDPWFSSPLVRNISVFGGTGLAAKLAETAIYGPLISSEEAPRTERELKVKEYLRDLAKKDGVAVEETLFSPAGEHYTSTVGRRGTVVLNSGNRTSPGIFAHELGHSRNFNKARDGKRNVLEKILGIGNMPAYVGSKTLTGVAGAAMPIAALFGASDKVLGWGGLAGAAASVPMVSEEVKASWNGYNMLRDAGMTRGESMASFKGVPTYLLAAAAPSIPWALSKAFGNFGEYRARKRKERDEEEKARRARED